MMDLEGAITACERSALRIAECSHGRETVESVERWIWSSRSERQCPGGRWMDEMLLCRSLRDLESVWGRDPHSLRYGLNAVIRYANRGSRAEA